MQEVITLSVFALFSGIYFGERITWTHVVGFALIASAPSSCFGGSPDLFDYSAILRGEGKIAGGASGDDARAVRRAASGLDASEQIADRQHDIGDDGDPERVFADKGNCHEFANDGQTPAKISEITATAVDGGVRFISSPPSLLTSGL